MDSDNKADSNSKADAIKFMMEHYQRLQDENIMYAQPPPFTPRRPYQEEKFKALNALYLELGYNEPAQSLASHLLHPVNVEAFKAAFPIIMQELKEYLEVLVEDHRQHLPNLMIKVHGLGEDQHIRDEQLLNMLAELDAAILTCKQLFQALQSHRGDPNIQRIQGEVGYKLHKLADAIVRYKSDDTFYSESIRSRHKLDEY